MTVRFRYFFLTCARNAHRKSRKKENHTEYHLPWTSPAVRYFVVHCYNSFRVISVFSALSVCDLAVVPFRVLTGCQAPGTHTEKAEKRKTTQNTTSHGLHLSIATLQSIGVNNAVSFLLFPLFLCAFLRSASNAKHARSLFLTLPRSPTEGDPVHPVRAPLFFSVP